MLSGKKKVECVSQIHELLLASEKELIEMIEKTSTSGALTDGLKEEGSYRLAKFLITIYFNKQPYSPHSKEYEKELANLSHFF